MRDWCFTPQFLDRFLDFFPQAEVHRLADAGHYVVEDAHEQIAPLMEEFLQRHPLDSPEQIRPTIACKRPGNLQDLEECRSCLTAIVTRSS